MRRSSRSRAAAAAEDDLHRSSTAASASPTTSSSTTSASSAAAAGAAASPSTALGSPTAGKRLGHPGSADECAPMLDKKRRETEATSSAFVAYASNGTTHAPLVPGPGSMSSAKKVIAAGMVGRSAVSRLRRTRAQHRNSGSAGGGSSSSSSRSASSGATASSSPSSTASSSSSGSAGMESALAVSSAKAGRRRSGAKDATLDAGVAERKRRPTTRATVAASSSAQQGSHGRARSTADTATAPASTTVAVAAATATTPMLRRSRRRSALASGAANRRRAPDSADRDRDNGNSRGPPSLSVARTTDGGGGDGDDGGDLSAGTSLTLGRRAHSYPNNVGGDGDVQGGPSPDKRLCSPNALAEAGAPSSPFRVPGQLQWHDGPAAFAESSAALNGAPRMRRRRVFRRRAAAAAAAASAVVASTVARSVPRRSPRGHGRRSAVPRDDGSVSSSGDNNSRSSSAEPYEASPRRGGRRLRRPAVADMRSGKKGRSMAPDREPQAAASASSPSGPAVALLAAGPAAAAAAATAAAAGASPSPSPSPSSESSGYRRKQGRGTKRDHRDPDYAYSAQRAKEGRNSPPGKRCRDGPKEQACSRAHGDLLSHVLRLAPQAVLSRLTHHDIAVLRSVSTHFRHMVPVHECVVCCATFLVPQHFELHRVVCTNGYNGLVDLPLMNHADWAWTPAQDKPRVDVLGTGSYGTVRLRHYGPVGADVAVKTIQAFPTIRNILRRRAARVSALTCRPALYAAFQEAVNALTRKHLIDAARNKPCRRRARRTLSVSDGGAAASDASEARGYRTLHHVLSEHREIVRGMDIPVGVRLWQAPILTEINVLKGLSGQRHVLQLLAVERSDNPFHLVHLVFRLYPSDLGKLIASQCDPDNASPVPAAAWMQRVSRYARQLCKVVALLHHYGVAHQDVKPQNIFLDDADDVVLGDFGMATLLGHGRLTSATRIVTVLYRAPELLAHTWERPVSYTAAIDVWAVGCVLAELLLLRPLFQQPRDGRRDPEALRVAVYAQVRALTGTTDKPLDATTRRNHVDVLLREESPFYASADAEEWTHLVDLISRMLDPNPSTRLQADTALHHPLFGTLSAMNSPHYLDA